MIHNKKEDEKIINEHKTHMMPLVGVINQGHLFEEMLPIHAQEDPYIIQLLGQQKHIDITSNAPLGWVARACSSLFFFTFLFYHSFYVGVLLLVDLSVHIIFCSSFSYVLAIF